MSEQIGGHGKAMAEAERLFRYDHLPVHLQKASKPFYDLAVTVMDDLPASAERTLCLRSLWEAKNLAVFATVEATEKEIS